MLVDGGHSSAVGRRGNRTSPVAAVAETGPVRAAAGERAYPDRRTRRRRWGGRCRVALGDAGRRSGLGGGGGRVGEGAHGEGRGHPLCMAALEWWTRLCCWLW